MKSIIKLVLGAFPAMAGIVLIALYSPNEWVAPVCGLLIGVSYGLAWIHRD